MIPFDETDLQIITIESDSGGAVNLYLLMLNGEADQLDGEALLDEMQEIETSSADDSQKDLDYQRLLDRMGIIEIFDQEEIEELIEEGLIDPEDLHYSVYQIVSEEMES